MNFKVIVNIDISLIVNIHASSKVILINILNVVL